MTLFELSCKCAACEACPLCKTRRNVVFGEGSEKAEVFFVGEAPGEYEDIEGRPFVGRSGKLLNDCLKKQGMSREKNIYIANLVKCRPPENRNPYVGEQDACIHFLQKQIELINPKIVVCLGRIAASRFLVKDFKVTKSHGEIFERDGRIYTATFHPAAILRNISQKPFFEADLEKISRLAELKQGG